MWDTLSHPWQEATAAAWTAYCAGSLPIGAVITDRHGVVIAVGRNRLFEERAATVSWLAGARIGHAEINALLSLDGMPANPKECALYTTTEPCPMCAGAIVMANIRAVHFAARDPWAGSTGLYQTSPYMQSKHMKVSGPADRPGGDRLEGVLFALQTAAFLEREAERSHGDPQANLQSFIDSLAAAHPAAVALGRRFYRAGTLRAMAAERLPARLMLDRLEEALAFEHRADGRAAV